MPQLNIAGVSVFYRDEGAGPPVVLGHSSTASGGQWRALFARLQGRYRLIAPDHLGYGRTAGANGSLPLAEHELAVIDCIMKTVNGPVHLIGHSYGGALMARAAVRAPDRVLSMTLIEPTLFYLLAATRRTAADQEIRAQARRVVDYVDAGLPEEAARSFIDYWVTAGAFEAMEERVRASVTAGIRKVRDEWATVFVAHGATPQALAALRMPIHLVAGSRTTQAAAGVMEVLRDLWPGAAYAEVPRAGHMSPLTHPEQVNEIIERFLESQTPRP